MEGKQKSVREIGEMYGISRHLLRRYESYELIRHSGRNKYGYLYYDEPMVERIVFIRHLQSCGFELPEIKALLNLDKKDIRDELVRRVDELKAKKAHIDKLISQTEKIIESINDLEDLRITEILKGEEK